MGIWQPHKGQMQPIVPKCSQTHTFWGTFFKFDPHCVYVVRIAVSYKHILWLWLWLFSSTGMPVQSDCQYSVYLLRTCVWLAHMSQMQHRYSNLGVGYAQRVGLWASSSLEQKWMEQREYVETDPSPNGFAREPGWKYQKPLRKPKKNMGWLVVYSDFCVFTKKWKWSYGRYAHSGIRVWRKNNGNWRVRKKASILKTNSSDEKVL